MVGRIEIVTPQPARPAPADRPRPGLGFGVGAGSDEEGRRRPRGLLPREWYQKLINGEKSLASLNVEIPNDYRAYLSLGRFRNALILDEQHRHPSPTLAKFIEAYDLEAAHVRENKP